MLPCLILSIKTYGSRVSGAIQGQNKHHPVNLGEVAIEKGALGSPSSTVGQLNIYIYIYIYELYHFIQVFRTSFSWSSFTGI